jgi:hypothetical protein
MNLSSDTRKRPNTIVVLLVGSTGVAIGLFAIATRPLLAVLVILGGMALAISSAGEMAASDSSSSTTNSD